jgi:hypothetical protein
MRGVAHYRSVSCDELWFRTGVKDRLRYIPVHDVYRALGQGICEALSAFHALTGCDSNSALAGVGKKKAWDILKQSNVHQESLSLLGQVPILEETTARKCEAFIFDLYPCSKKAPGTADERRYVIFARKSKRMSSFPRPQTVCNNTSSVQTTRHLFGDEV